MQPPPSPYPTSWSSLCFSSPAFPLVSQRFQPNPPTEPHEDICHQEDPKPQGATHLAAGGCPADPTNSVKASGVHTDLSHTPCKSGCETQAKGLSRGCFGHSPAKSLPAVHRWACSVGFCVCGASTPSLALAGNGRTMFKSHGHYENPRVVSRACVYVSVTLCEAQLAAAPGQSSSCWPMSPCS